MCMSLQTRKIFLRMRKNRMMLQTLENINIKKLFNKTFYLKRGF